MEDFLSSQWESTSVRHAFIRKVRSFSIHYVTQRLLLCICLSFREPGTILLISSTAGEIFSHVLNRTACFCVCGQVYFILAAQLAVTFSVVAVFTFV